MKNSLASLDKKKEKKRKNNELRYSCTMIMIDKFKTHSDHQEQRHFLLLYLSSFKILVNFYVNYVTR